MGLEWTESTLESESCHSMLNDGRLCGTLGVVDLPNTRAGKEGAASAAIY